MTSTQVESLAALNIPPLDAAVLACITAYGPICRDALCKAANIRVSTACGAVDRLKKRGLVEIAADKVWNHTTKRNVQAYKAIGEQNAEQITSTAATCGA